MSETDDRAGGRSAAAHAPMPLAEARERILAEIEPIQDTEQVDLPEALHRVLAETVVSTVDVPSARNASMDGFALGPHSAASEAPTVFECIGESFAGHPYDGSLADGQCIRIMTGAVVPPDAVAVVMQENTRPAAHEGRISVEVLPDDGANIRAAGEDIAAGATVLTAGHYLRPADIAVMASTGHARVTVRRRPRVAFFSTGDELRPIDGPLATGEIYDSNRYGLAASIGELGMEGINLGAIPDDPVALAQAFDKAAGCDALVTSGGVSVGEADFVVDVLVEKGQIDFWRVAIKPGKPLAFGLLGDTRFFGLPGNPVSTAVTFIQLVRPALVRLAGGRPASPIRFQLPTTTRLSKRPGREHYLRARMNFDGEFPSVTAIDHQGSGVMHSMSQADAFIVLPAQFEDIAADTAVIVEPFAQPIWGMAGD